MTRLAIDLLEEQVQASPHAIAIEAFDTGPLSYAELWGRAAAVAARLRREGVVRDSVVTLAIPKSGAYVVALIGVWMAGGAFLPLDPSLPPVRRDAMVRVAGATITLTPKDVPSCRADAVRVTASPTDLAYVAFTSGSTGEPKGVLVEQRGLVPVLTAQMAAFELHPRSRSLFFLSTSFDAHLSDVGTALLAGATLVIPGDLAPGDVERELSRQRITYADLPPSLLPHLDEAACAATLETLVIGGEVASFEAARRFARALRLVSVYGPTEATIATHAAVVDPGAWDQPYLGEPFPHVRTEIDRSGELLLGGVALARGYAGDPVETARRFVGEGAGRMYRTGDRVEVAAGGLVFRGRFDRQVKIGGVRIEPEEIERAALSIDGIAEAVARPSPPNAPRELILLVTPTPRSPRPSTAELRARLSELLPKALVPRTVRWVEAFPTTASGKTDRGAGSPLASLLGEIAGRALDRAPLSTSDEFSQHADSLAALRFLALAHAHGIPLRVPHLSYGDLSSIADAVEGDAAADVRDTTSLRAPFEPRAAPPKTVRLPARRAHVVLLTGITGRLGCFVVKELLLRGVDRVVAPVRAADPERARARVAHALGGVDPRIDVQRASDGELDFAAVDAVLHLAADTSAVRTREELFATNVTWPRRLARAAEVRGAAFHHVSTLAVFAHADDPPAIAFEEDDPPEVLLLRGGYAQSKWQAEWALRNTGDAPVWIHRLGLLTGDDAAPFEAILRGLARLRKVPRARPGLTFDLSPIERVATAIAALVVDPPEDRRTFHHAARRTLDLGEIEASFRDSGAPLERVDRRRWACAIDGALERDGRGDVVHAALGLARAANGGAAPLVGLDLFRATGIRFDTTHTEAALDARGISPPCDPRIALESYVRRAILEVP